ncbi:glycoside hydrolase family 95 protein [Sphingobacterium bovistauri]|uniref:Glycoside hydrolase family 95 protein n=1 Tax=Sphingobacterium bovistauri TaxID=2781959 RepID=A0ABS7Z3I9_9SPHI|nr:glycoside hydrolase family 95 protein [Sphingobacterium bovistauri]MCA5004748.1 glycoside hydrolase family 95 protein [Sphingobacterium bovistauri]
MALRFKFMSLLGILCLHALALQAQDDLILRYDKPARIWEEALPIGNGRIGAMVFGGVEQEHIQFNEETLWTHGPRNYNKRGAYAYLDSIRSMLINDEQSKAEKLAMEKFMGEKSAQEDSKEWLDRIKKTREQGNNPSTYKYDDKGWKTLQVPSYEGWETVGLEGVDGAVWFRKEIFLTKQQIQNDWTLDLNKVRDMDFTYINGQLVGAEDHFDKVRNYKIPKGLLREGKNIIAVQVLNFIGKGGIAGYKDTSIKIGLKNKKDTVVLDGDWKYFIQDTNAPLAGRFQATYQPFGDIKVHFPHKDVSQYRRTLDIANAEAQVIYTSNGTTYNRTYFASFPDNALVIKYESSKPQQLSFEVELASKHLQHEIKLLDKQTINLKVQVKNGVLKGDALLHVKLVGGNISSKGNKLLIRGANAATLYLTAATNFVNYNTVSANSIERAESTMHNIKGTTFEELRKIHQKDYKSLFDSFSIKLGPQNTKETDQRLKEFSSQVDPAFAALYVQYGRYLLIASSREGTQAANLQGVWNHLLEPSWDSKYTTNINLQMNYWPAEVLNLSRLHQPLFKLIREVSEKGKETAKSYYNARGWVLHHNTDLWRGTAPINNSNHGIWPTGGAWLVHHIWESYLYNQDLNLLKENYDIIKGATLFFKDFLVPHHKTGELVTSPSNSPEHGGLVIGPAMDSQLVRNLFRTYIDASKLLDVDAALRDSIQVMLPKVAKDKIGKYGQLQEWIEDVDNVNNKHRHISHLWALHPGNEINWLETPDLWNAAKQSLIYRGDEGTGWSLAWKINFWARLLDEDKSRDLVKMLLRPADKNGGSYPNLFDAHPPFQIDGNFGGAAGIIEMIIQSHTQYIHLLPALSKDFSFGEIKGVKVRGGFVVDMSWKDNRVTELKIKSLSGGLLQLKQGSIHKKYTTEKGKTYIFDANLTLIK